MRNHKKWIQIVILSVVVVIAVFTISRSLQTSGDVPKTGGHVPEFSLLQLDGGVFDSADRHGKAYILNFWGSFCPGCVNEMPLLQRYYEQQHGGEYDIFGVNLSEDPITARSYTTRNGIHFPILLDKNQKTEKQFGVRSYPTTYFVSSNGTITDIFVGEMKEADLQLRIKRMLSY